MLKDHKKFEYIYSAPHQREIETIRKKYPAVTASAGSGQKETAKLDHLRRLDRRVEHSALTVSLALGLLGAAAMGASMLLAFGAGLILFSVCVGMAGLALAALALPVYQLMVEYRRKKFASEIARLAEELTQ